MMSAQALHELEPRLRLLPSQLTAARAFMRYLNTFDAPALAALLHPHFRHQLLPESISRTLADGAETRNGAGFLKALDAYRVGFKGMRWTILEEVHGVDRVIMHVMSTGASQINGRPLRLEYMVTFKFEPGDDKIVWFDEFVDSKCSSEYFAALRADIARGKAERRRQARL